MAKDIYHNIVRSAIEKQDWLVTDDPYNLTDKEAHIDYEIDLGAEKLIAAEKGTEKIAIEVKSFLRASLAHEFHSIFGQYLIYMEGLKRLEPDRILYLAIPKFADARLVDYPFLLDIIGKYQIKIIVLTKSHKKSSHGKNSTLPRYSPFAVVRLRKQPEQLPHC